jgi:hypothetical protein
MQEALAVRRGFFVFRETTYEYTAEGEAGMIDRDKLKSELMEAYSKEIDEYTDAELVSHHQTLVILKDMPAEEFLAWLDSQELP